jgi:hypothetical protein
VNTLEELATQRREFLAALAKNKGINLDIFDDFYPDEAHFIYELLQNAEDTGATEVIFELSDSQCVFEHNGERQFNLADIDAITGINNSTKKDDPDRIGKFGVGFKSVYTYTSSPTVYSSDYSFQIERRFLPVPVAGRAGLGKRTRFEFPFNNPRKSRDEAYAEVKAGLQQLSETTLLFLQNLQYIRWRVEGIEGAVLRHEHSPSHIEVLKQVEGRDVQSSHWLRFSAAVSDVKQFSAPMTGIEKQTVAIVFELAFRGEQKSFDPEKAIADQLRIIPSERGMVSVFFPADKEVSGLRYHLHAPFVPELSRASIKNTPENKPLFEQLAGLSARALHVIKDLGLLNGDFLAVLPNNDDPLPERYKVIRTAIVAEMKAQALVPTYTGSHAPASRLCQARATLKALLSDEDLAFVTGRGDQPTWAITAPQRSQAQDKFLNSLGIASWDAEDLKDFFEARARVSSRSWIRARVDPLVLTWMAAKPQEWHQALYAILGKYCEDVGDHFDLHEAQIVRTVDGSYRLAKDAFFQTGVPSKKDPLPRVDEEILTVGTRKGQQADARKFLVSIGVKEPGELEEVTLLLKTRYGPDGDPPSDKVYLSDLKRLMAFADRNPHSRNLFESAFLFRVDAPEFEWAQAGHAYVDAPILSTGLRWFYESIKDEGERRWPLSDWYEDQGLSLDKFAKFALFAGVEEDFQGLWVETDCSENENYRYLLQVGGERYSSPVNRDFAMTRRTGDMLRLKTVEGSRLVWTAMCNAPPQVLKARFQRNTSHGSRYANSQLVCWLRDSAWVPQRDGSFVTPRQATTAKLPEGFSYDLSYQWLQLVEFGSDERKRSAESVARAAKRAELGFESEEDYQRALEFSKLPADEQEQILGRARETANEQVELPERPVRNADLRTARVGEQARLTPAKEAEVRERSVQLGADAAKIATKQYLEGQYRDSRGELICQVCKTKMPFRLPTGAFYFEAVEVVEGAKKRYRETHLALCPNHAAAYRHANTQREAMAELIATACGNEVEVELGGLPTTIYFTQTHLADVRACLLSEKDVQIASTIAPR